MGVTTWIARLVAEHPRGTRVDIRRDLWEVEVDDYGFADVKVRTGDLDGSGEAPGVQLEFEHEMTRGPVALALSAREAELLAKALAQGAKLILPHMRLRASRSKFKRSRIKQPRPLKPGVAETIELSTEEAEGLIALIKRHGDKELEGVLAQLEVPF